MAVDMAVEPIVWDLAGADFTLPPPGTDTTVTLFDATEIYWDGGDPGKNHRDADAVVNLPTDGTFSKITLHIQLGCRSGGCDPWDRRASIGIVDPANGNRPIEIGRYMTPYGVGGSWDIDVTDLRPLLSGTRTAHAFIDTWVGAGKGWTLTATLSYVGGVPAEIPVAVIPLPWGDFDYGDPTKPINSSLPPQTIQLPPPATHAAVRVNVTGHGQGNLDNCSEFCQKNHSLLVDGTATGQHLLWRADCAKNPIMQGQSSWKLSRAGWCPGDRVQPWRIDLGTRTAPFSLGYAVDDYVNTCRGSDCINQPCGPAQCNPDDCALCNGSDCGTPKACDDNNGVHTPPYYAFSAVVIAYR